MSVRMALAKLCACTCGGALIGTGAMQITDVPKARAQTVKSCSPCVGKKVVRKRHAARKPVKRIRRVVTTKRIIRTATPQTQVVTQTIPLPPIPYAPFPQRGGFEGGGSGGGVTVIGGGFGGGIGGGFFGGFFGGSSGGGSSGSIVVTSTTTGGLSTTSSSTSGGVSTSTGGVSTSTSTGGVSTSTGGVSTSSGGSVRRPPPAVSRHRRGRFDVDRRCQHLDRRRFDLVGQCQHLVG